MAHVRKAELVKKGSEQLARAREILSTRRNDSALAAAGIYVDMANAYARLAEALPDGGFMANHNENW